MFLDHTTIDVTGGAGGRGCVSWRREKFVPKGGPDGGNGGRGGDVVLIADDNTDTLSDFSSRKRFEAPKGGYGMGSNKNGRDGEDLELKCPPGTLVYEDGVVVADLREHGTRVVVARGGKGGFGNAHFLSSTRQRPDFAELGQPGEQKLLKLELKLVADIGIIGYPSAGKSTLISVISRARPKIGDYPFTTLIPNLGVVSIGERGYVVCDVPGLIEGASEGKGLGHTFLRHIERCGALLHLLDISRALKEGGEVDIDLLEADYKAIRKELEAYSPLLASKRELVALNKIDLVGNDASSLVAALKKRGIDIFTSISAATKNGTDELATSLLPIVLEERANREKAALLEEEEALKELPVLKPAEVGNRMGAYKVMTQPDGTIMVRGKRLEQFTIMTDFANQGGITRFRDVAERIGLRKAIGRLRSGDTPVYIGEVQVDSYLF